ncbi:glycosyltransferase [Rhodobacterales bacterium HKCCE2091]|nr:glycosyltransferase [Rhodobacterales bacterium HKCCE2091]
MSTLRIAMVTTFYPPYNFGGDGIYVQRMARALARRGHHVEVIHDTDGYRAMTGRDPGPAEPDPDGVVVHALGSRFPGLSALRTQQTGRPGAHGARIAEILGDRFDVIHYHNISLIGGPGVWRLGTGLKLHTAHEHWLVCPSHILWRDNRELCDAPRCLTCVVRHGRPPQLWRATGLIEREAHNVDAFLMLSRSAEANHRRFGFTPPTEVVPSFLPDVPPLPPAETPVHPRPFFLFVGRLEIIKGLQDVIPAFTPDVPADLLIAGSGNYEPELRRLAEGRPNVRFLGHMRPDDLRRLYAEARAVITPSRCYEVFPLVVLEAFREGAPILARDLGPYPEIVEQSGGGLLFRDADDLGRSLVRLARDPDLAKRMGADGRRAFDMRWSEGVALGAYLDLIDRLRAGKTPDAA